MHKAWTAVTLIVLAFTHVVANAGVMGDLRDQVFPVDTSAYGGDVLRPSVCPAATNLVSFQIVNQDSVSLYIIDLTTREMRRISPKRKGATSGGGKSDVTTDRDLAWRPVKSPDGGIWAAFISDAGGVDQVYLYEVLEDYYHLLRSPGDSPTEGVKMTPSWSPDGSCLAYTSTHEGDADIYVVRSMDDVLKDPSDTAFSAEPYHHALVPGEGDQLGGVWCPTASTGYLAYMHVPAGDERKKPEIRVFDPRYGRHYTLGELGSSDDFFAPSWSPSGKHLAFLRADTAGSPFAFDSVGHGGSVTSKGLRLGMASVDYRKDGDSLVISSIKGGSEYVFDVLTVAPNRDPLYARAAWLPDGKHVLVSSLDKSKNNPFAIVAVHLWIKGLPAKYWLGTLSMASERPHPMDVDLSDGKVAFVFSEGQRQALGVADIALQSMSRRYERLEVAGHRRQWWDAWSGAQRKRGGFVDWLFKPVVGPNLGINTRGGIIAAGALVVAAVVLGGGDDIVIQTGRDWRPPDFP